MHPAAASNGAALERALIGCSQFRAQHIWPLSHMMAKSILLEKNTRTRCSILHTKKDTVLVTD